MRPRMLLCSLAVLLPVLASAPALAQGTPASGSPCSPGGPFTNQYPPSACGLALGTSEVRPGQRLPVSGSGFRPNSTVALEFRSAPVSLGTAQADAAGTFNATVVIPADATPGQHTLAATGVNPSGTPRELTAAVTVLGDETARGGALPRTGSASAIPTGLAALALMGVGSLVVVATRRRRPLT